LQYFPAWQIAPTEQDTYFRHQLIQGYVHDYGAAMLGGVAGHAGLFSKANDLAKNFKSLCKTEYYADRRYFQPYTGSLLQQNRQKKPPGHWGVTAKTTTDKSWVAPKRGQQKQKAIRGNTRGYPGQKGWGGPQKKTNKQPVQNGGSPQKTKKQMRGAHPAVGKIQGWQLAQETFFKKGGD